MVKNHNRCPWSNHDPLYIRYHDREWGVPVYDENIQFEFLVLESAQAGLSWFTILKRREYYREVYGNFDPRKVALFTESDLERLLKDARIIRNRKKIEASINNAARFLEVQREFGSFTHYIWHFTEHQPVINLWKELSEIPAKTALSDEISKDLKKRGFQFIGSTILYAHLQATGVVNDHLVSCFRHQEIVDSYMAGDK